MVRRCGGGVLSTNRAVCFVLWSPNAKCGWSKKHVAVNKQFLMSCNCSNSSTAILTTLPLPLTFLCDKNATDEEEERVRWVLLTIRQMFVSFEYSILIIRTRSNWVYNPEAEDCTIITIWEAGVRWLLSRSQFLLGYSQFVEIEHLLMGNRVLLVFTILCY